ncbi:MAG: hypothetical protein F7C35_04970 [Desulfurococcales archaeon]|nr:hypothetical protein [Desulfurococcales archaeon]
MSSDLLSRVHTSLRSKIMDPSTTARLLRERLSEKGVISIGTSGFGSVGYPKTFPRALADLAAEEDLKLIVLTGASAYAMDDYMAEKGVVDRRYPYQNNPKMRKLINEGVVNFMDYHLGEWPSLVENGWLYRFMPEGLDVAVVEAAKVLEDGFIPTGSVGAVPAWVELAKYVIIEVNLDVSEAVEGIHDIYRPKHGEPIPIRRVSDRIGAPKVKVPPGKILGIVESHGIDHGGEPAEPGDVERRIAENLVNFLLEEVSRGRLPHNLYPLESGVGVVNDAVFKNLREAGFKGLTAWTEVVQDSLLNLYEEGVMDAMSCTSLMLTPGNLERFYAGEYDRSRIILRPQDVTNNWEVIRRLRVIAVNTAVEFDIYGNVNSTHILGSKIINGIGGSADFSRNAYLSIFIAPSTRKGGRISTVVPMVSHVDTIDHDVDVIITEQGVCDLRGLSPRERAELIIERCAHPDFRDALWSYYKRALGRGGHIPHMLEEAFSFHIRLLRSGSMK